MNLLFGVDNLVNMRNKINLLFGVDNLVNTRNKINLLFGVDNLVNMRNRTKKICVGMIEPNNKIENFRGMCLQDGPAGVRTSASTTSWPAQINTASTFNRTLWSAYGKAYGGEFREKGINVASGPAMNILRTPQAGRIWEIHFYLEKQLYK